MNIFKKINNFLSSYKLAMSLLVTIFISCIIGVVFFSQEDSWALIFSTLWFNGLLVMLVVNVAFCFFGRVWRRKITLISFGMILFHLSFVAILGGVVYNSLFYFTGSMRLTEGETLTNGDPKSYDYFERGRFFDFSGLKGETKLIDVLDDYKRDGTEEEWAYEISVGEGSAIKQDIIYITKSFDYNGVGYYMEKEGYSILTILYDKEERELYGAYVPLQSHKQQKDDIYLYTTGSKDSPGSFPFPQGAEHPLINLRAAYFPDPIKRMSGEVVFQVNPFAGADVALAEKHGAEGRAPVGERVRLGDYYLSVGEVRYWAGMTVRYAPGKPIVLGSLWVGLGGMVITFIGRLRRDIKLPVKPN